MHQFALLREAEFFKFVDFLIDEFHFKNHKACSVNYSSEEYLQRAVNYSVAEQKNRPLAEHANSLSHMDQVSFLKVLRFKLAAMNIYQHEKATKSSRYFWRAPEEVKTWQERPIVNSTDGLSFDEEEPEPDN